jgi:hypothetical protein
VMVFAQGNFSIEAMKVLRSCNFLAAVNTVPHPAGRPVALTLSEIAQPAVLRYGGFPLFLRRYVRETRKEDVAFNFFFGRPTLVVEHHEVFRRPETLVEAVSMINSIEPEIHWSNLEAAVMNSTLRRRTSDGTDHVRAYSGAVQIANDADLPRRVLVEWNHGPECPSIEQVLQDGAPGCSYEVDDSSIRLSAEMAPRSSQTFSVVYRNDFSSLEGLGLRWRVKAFVRRRLSEVRDNYISKNQLALNFARALQRRVSRRGGATTSS